MFQTLGFEREVLNGTRHVETAVAILMGDLTEDAPLLRIHSQCFTGEVLGSLRCDCGDQLDMAMQAIADEGRGLVIYEHQEGRGIGLMAKLQAYALQDEGLDTVEANHALGFMADHRDFSFPAMILHDLGIGRVRLLSNNPSKSRALSDAGIDVVAQISCETPPNPHSIAYLRTKKEKMGHNLTFGQHESTEYAMSPHFDLHEQNTENDDAITPDEFEFANIEEAIHELKAGRMVVVVDDEDRENEGDLTMAAEMITPEAINFMATHGRGLICLAMTGERLDKLDLAPMVRQNSALGGTAFTVSIDVKGNDVTTGISAYDRAQTIKAAVDPGSYPEDFARPGHVFPLCARAGGVLERRGQTEAAVDLAGLAGLYPAGVICEIINDDGTMARVPDLVRFCKTHNLVMITVADLARYRFESDYEGALGAIDGLFPVCLRDTATTELGHLSSSVVQGAVNAEHLL
ncbi:MAG: 3,4-dihydroxy 2-butanone 4-phosphate synthase / cyclohydrolase [Blastocatellia bacterium]|nr:3,4-dihydroxy 2-butanone 4-phosphate synthase / cyclohydrolase [Blastocatellia bacterium]